ncbi:MAG: BolA family transcriptional regulator [Caldilineaceae bacterium]|nr:BolA family transcriptional regulator [Caldilineaceae bacterium]
MIDHIEATIRQSIPDARVRVVDPYNDGQHFEAYVVSDAFEGLPLVRQHQLVLKSLKDEFDANTVHAVALKTFTPAKWEQAQAGYAFDL